MPYLSRKPLTVLICCELFALAGGFVADAQAQSMQPLRVDPVLLGLPPAPPPSITAPAPAPAPVKEDARVEVKPVEMPVVESRESLSGEVARPPVSKEKSRKASPNEIPARAVAPAVAPEVAKPSPAPVPLESAPVVTAVPAGRTRQDATTVPSRTPLEPQARPAPEAIPKNTASEAVVVPAAPAQPRPAPQAAGAATAAAGNLPALQVHPGLLGLPVAPVVASTPAVRPATPPVARSQDAPVARQEPSAPEPVQTNAAVSAPRVVQAAPSTQPVPPAQPAQPVRPGNVAAMTPGTLPALQVHPGLLGMPLGAGAAPPALSADTAPPLVAASGPRDEEEVPDFTPTLSLRMAAAMVPPPAKSDEPRPIFLSAQRMSGTIGSEFAAEGDAELRKIGVVAKADRLTYWPVDDEIEGLGNVRLEQGDDVYTGPKLRLKLEEQVGFFDQPSYYIKRLPPDKDRAQSGGAGKAGEETASGFAQPRVLTGLKSTPAQLSMSAFAAIATVVDKNKMERTATEARGEAERIEFEGENQVRIKSGTYTTCKPGNDGWYVTASDLKLDYDRQVAEGTDGKVVFLGVPILYSPWLSFSLNNERKSGFLSPTFGSSSKSGLELTLPYYWNITPDMDATISPRVLSKRGTQLNTEFRYLDAAYRGQVRGELLQNDKNRDGDDRYGISLVHTQAFANGLSGAINYNRVSDDNYFTDLSSRVANTAQTQLLQQGMLGYGSGWWNVTANAQSYQTLQPDPKNLVAVPYRLLPQITLNARQPDLYRTDSSFFGQYTAFSHPDLNKDEAQRTVLYPQVALPYVTPGWYATPKLGVHATQYSLNRRAPGSVGPDSINRTLPVFSLDSGMTFERPSNWFSRDYTQTLEPRLYYLNVPYRNQDKIPVFDSSLADFNFAQIFSENQFSGQDRFNNANQLTAAVTSRLIDPASGNEIMRAMFGQRFYFSQQKVTLSGQAVDADEKWQKSDFLAAFSGQILPKVYADTALQYGAADRDVKQYSLGARYLPEPGKVLNASYRYIRDTPGQVTKDGLDQIDVSGQWPVFGGWHAVGRYNYSIKEKQPIETIAGLEYNGGCWVVRVVGQRLATSEAKASTALFVQLELNDFSRIGSNPLELLRRNVQGYGMVNRPTADPVFGQ
jgi:LPS-assembly protein